VTPPRRSRVLVARLAGELTGWTPRVDLRDGLAKTIEWIQANTSRYRVEDYAI
jgi:nucleoside-diphosphate-sugar epimerase